jgi:hypothetical protein
VNETGIVTCGLEPVLPLIPNPSGPGVAPAYVPGPQPERTVRVVLDSGGCNGEPASFRLYETYPTLARPHEVFDVPHERWEAAQVAFLAMEEEIEKLIDERFRSR